MTDVELVMVNLVGWEETFPEAIGSYDHPNRCGYYGTLVYLSPTGREKYKLHNMDRRLPCTLPKGHTCSHIMHFWWGSKFTGKNPVIGEIG